MIPLISLLAASPVAQAGPLQTLRSLTTQGGKYSNEVPAFTHSRAYIEVCYVAGARYTDAHPVGGSTSGGNCEPGDVGYIIEGQQRAGLRWSSAMEACLLEGMRLPEMFEFVVACHNAGPWKLQNMGSVAEWASNVPNGTGEVPRAGVNCATGRSSLPESDPHPFRCAL